MLVINCVNDIDVETLIDVHNDGAGVFTYSDSDNLSSVTANRKIVWFVFDFLSLFVSILMSYFVFNTGEFIVIL